VDIPTVHGITTTELSKDYAAGSAGAAAAASLALAALSACAASRSRRFFFGLALLGLLEAVRFMSPAASSKRATRSVGSAPTESHYMQRCRLSLSRFWSSLLSIGSKVPICSM
jgi:hypothetical protein